MSIFVASWSGMHLQVPFATAGAVRAPLACKRRARRPRLSAFDGETLSRKALFIAKASLAVHQPTRRRDEPDVVVRAVAGGWALAGAALCGLFGGLLLSKLAQTYLASAAQANFKRYSAENAVLRAKVEELQQIVTKYQPMAYKDMRLRFTKGVNKSVILGLVDSLLANKEVNIWWLPDSLERVLYFNVISLMLSVLDEMVESMSMNVAGHNVKLQLSFLDLDVGMTGEAARGQPTGLVPVA